MSARYRNRQVARCCECRKPVDITDPTLHRVEGPAGLNMSQLHRIITNYWHAECWEAASRFAEESRREAEIQRRADNEALINTFLANGQITEEQAAELRIKNGGE